MSKNKDATDKHQADQTRSDAARPPGVSKSPIGIGISTILMVGWLLFIAYLALKLGQ